MDSNQDKRNFYIAIAVIILLLLTTTAGFIFNSKNKRTLNSEKLRNETLLSEKLLGEKEVARLKNEFSSLNLKYDDISRKITEAQNAIAEKDKRIAGLSRSLNSQTRSKSELEALQKAKAEIDNSYTLLKSEYDKLASQNSDLQKSMAEMEKLNTDLSKKFEQSLLFNSDNFETYGSRGKKTEKLTIRAFWTKKLNLNFEVPQSLTDEISFKVTIPDGKVVTPPDKSLSWNISDDSRNLTASLSPVSGQFEKSRQVALTYASPEKLQKGEYKIQVLCKEAVIGNCRVKLK